MENKSFIFNTVIYRQKTGAPMGSNLSPILAEALVSEIFRLAIDTITPIKPKFCRFYVDDSFLILNNRFVDKFFKHINNIGKTFGKISFTIENESNNAILFLDVKVTRIGDEILTNVYKKSTHSWYFRSHHCIQHKLSVIKTLSHQTSANTNKHDTIDQELAKVKDFMLLNDYPPELVQKTIAKCKSSFSSSQVKINFDISKTIVITYHRGISEKIKRILNKHNINVVFKSGLSLQNIFNKNKRTDLDKSCVVYEIHCYDCDAKYVGETKRNLKFRIREHKDDLSKGGNKSNVAYHSITENHKINFDEVKIIYFENNTKVRKNLESWHIEKLKNQGVTLMNIQQNAQTCIPSPYLAIISRNKCQQ